MINTVVNVLDKALWVTELVTASTVIVCLGIVTFAMIKTLVKK